MKKRIYKTHPNIPKHSKSYKNILNTYQELKIMSKNEVKDNVFKEIEDLNKKIEKIII